MSSKPTKYVVICFFSVTPAWLALTRQERESVRDRSFMPILARYHERVGMRLLDAWAYTNRSTDVLLFETTDLRAYHDLMEELRNSELLASGLLARGETIITVEDNFIG